MDEWFQEALSNGIEISVTVVAVRLVLAMVLGGVVAAIYHATQRLEGKVEPSFVATLVLLCILIAMVSQVVGNSVARAFSLVGALSIVRFRTVVEDTRDTAFVIFAVIVGMAVGSGALYLALAGIPVVAVAAAILRAFPRGYAGNADLWNLHLRIATALKGDTPWDTVLAKHARSVRLESTATARQGAAVDLSYAIDLKSTPLEFLAEVNRIEGVQQVELKRKS